MAATEERGFIRSGAGAVLGVLVTVLLFILLFQWAGGVTPYDVVTLDQQSRLELEAIFLFFLDFFAIALGAPLGCWALLRRAGLAAAGTTALLTIPIYAGSTWVAFSLIPSDAGSPVLLPWALLAAAALAGGMARVAVLALRSLSNPPA